MADTANCLCLRGGVYIGFIRADNERTFGAKLFIDKTTRVAGNRWPIAKETPWPIPIPVQTG